MTVNHVKCRRLLSGEMFPIKEVQETSHDTEDETSSSGGGMEAAFPVSPLPQSIDKSRPHYQHDNLYGIDDESDNDTIAIANTRTVPMGDGSSGTSVAGKNPLSFSRDDSFRCQTIVSLEEVSQGSDVSKEDGERDRDLNRGLMYFFHRRWRRANDVWRWDPSFNRYSGCATVFDYH